MSSTRVVNPEHRPNRDSKGASVYPTSLEGRTGVVEERKAKNYRHVTRKRSPDQSRSSRVVPSENRPNRQSEGTGIYNNVSLTDRTGARVDLRPESRININNAKIARSEILNNPTQTNKGARKVVQDKNLFKEIGKNLIGGKTKKTKSRNFRKTRHRSRV